MLWRTLPVLLAAAILAALPAPVSAQDPPPLPGPDVPVIRRTVDLVNINFTVQTRRNRLVTDLERENFSIIEDGEPQRILHFNRETNLPLRIGLLMDTSNSVRPRMKFQQEAAIDFLYHVIRRGQDQAFLMIFDNEPSVIHDFTDDVGSLTDTIHGLRAGGGTALYDAVFDAALKKLIQPPPDPQNREIRRILVVISDGDDNLSRHTRADALDMLHRAEAVVYAISTSTDWMAFAGSGSTPTRPKKTRGDEVLEYFAEETGGRVFFPYRADDLSRSFLEIGDELRSQYSLAYTPTNRNLDGKFRNVKIETDRRGLVVRARKGYYAPPPSAADSGARPAPPGSPPGQP